MRFMNERDYKLVVLNHVQKRCMCCLNFVEPRSKICMDLNSYIIKRMHTFQFFLHNAALCDGGTTPIV